MMTALRTYLDSLDGPQVVGTTLIVLAVAWLVVGVWRWIVAGPSLDDTDRTPTVPRPRVQSRMSDADWQRLLDLQAQARADIAAEADHFDLWTQEMSA